ncbi:MAG: hypothetical protein A2Y45_06225 [Tenericutes bacterium GWC2_34_14]|nr:MAG: hypothetical protein A2Y45_06225 [Tenericutes bacterium GWC2_34_14]OHE33541.1 MAG: hypothetical protein A2012_03585 [Tenericutes bacterium GWE2_34_108]OHE36826.1 MAG: hypothetical protein A2Y46_09385 [Tenericutes bacterium GWF1_35_14]OHE38094.1 MAG: hypothetical protein A2Y44_09280 [Tenericutes bacterium GWF2_35_184]OHE43389.1 MAG: hypothetical protein A2221_06455 [Tenericutes bacterium RIFOXYA2_FULL_36_32]OHE45164.1 MAG: hypothetical protein A3K26_05630 [Tenericutes bacterium RIFOXYA1
MDKITLFDHLVDIDEREKDAIKGTLRCACGNDYFKIYYFGKRTRGILSPDILKINKKIQIVAHCELCYKSYGFDNHNTSRLQFNQHLGLTPDLVMYDKDNHKVRFSFNYFPEKFKSNEFESLIIEVLQNNKKWRVIVEE